ncbi:3-oxoacyl-[acyl-carrier-protein] synthase-3 [Thermocatellispora tengchongensis]|uniref:3-oxoacyl-[acyl-carrier-protein] synthase-3 n=1 Tax=Thermocatellispora tengchongensis TaxID=1073253 RepID=A0A840PPE4_9ACTN|nr:ketoacyl-ACP synthase III [Thermocatellispora tengchongensis]MBB5139590.1 3-oxoacyl-[acyl-carrier-protein] synthase-3 [Thermocatellispora tengchongensis]
MSAIRTRLAGVAAHLPETTMTTAELEDLLAARNPGLELPRGVIHNGSGVRRRHIAPPHEKPSDLAVHAARRLLEDHDLQPHDLDLIVYAGVTVDLLEPATAHVVAAKLGADCPVFDVRNACNGMLNGIQVADALVAGGRHRRVLVCCGELATAFMPWTLSDAEEFFTVAAAYTVSDAGAALLLEAGTDHGVLGHRFAAYSAGWEAATVPLLNITTAPSPALPVLRPLTVSASGLVRALQGIDYAVFRKHLGDLGLTWDDFAAVCVHQASLAALWKFCEHAGIPKDKVVVTIPQHGNLVAATLPVQLAQAVASGRVRRGDLVALVGLASGFSAGIVVVRW